MRLGFAYDLRDDYLAEGFSHEETAEFDRLDTIEAIETALRGLGHRVERIGNVKALAKALVEGRRWDMVFNIAEGLRGIGREAQVPALLDAYDLPYTFSDPLVMAMTLHKGVAKQVVRDRGVPTAPFRVIERAEEADAVALPFPLFIKPVAEGTGRGISGKSKVASKAELKRLAAEIIHTYRQPALVETFLSGREFTVGIVGEGRQAEALGTLEVTLLATADRDAYGYLNKEEYDTRVGYRLVKDAMAKRAATVALDAWRALGCRDGGRVDLRADEHGMPHFLEVNPLAGLNPVRSDLPILAGKVGISFERLIGLIMEAATKRIFGAAESARRGTGS
ncbi:MAG: D-alanine--D-alanine ligase [Proteobacteria bacterium]|nr:D-alanine--D-alanine ligase [Pseudomonadota bacterium]MBI3499157.1 D-alanine--D-alanine ligase [Pseudomonadota bacterium]